MFDATGRYSEYRDAVGDRIEAMEAEIEEMASTLGPEEFKQYLHNLEKRRQPEPPYSEPRDLADGLAEFIASKSGRPLTDDYKENSNKEEVDPEVYWAELDAFYHNYLQTDEWKKECQKDIEEGRREEMYDFGLGKMSTEGAISDFYGWDIYDRILKEIRESNELPDSVRKTGFVSHELYKIMKDMRAGKIAPKSKKQKSEKINNPQKTCRVQNKIIQQEKKPEELHFLMKNRGLIRNEAYRKMFKSRVTVYEWIWANLVRKGWKDKKGYPIKKQYYDKGLLAYCSSYRKIGRDCFLHKNIVKEYIDEFREAGIIKVEHLTPVGKKRGQSVFILGEWKTVNGKPDETLYFNEVFLGKKGDGQNVPN